MSRKWSLILALLVLTALYADVSLAAEEGDKPNVLWSEVQVVSGKNPSLGILWYERDFSKYLGMYAIVEKESSDKYRQFYVGPKLKVSEQLTVGCAIGREAMTDLRGIRRNCYYEASLGDFSSFGTFENGVSGPWHKVTVTYAINERWGAGIIDQTTLGFGPRVEYNVPEKKEAKKMKPQLWLAIPFERGTDEISGARKTERTVIIGINFTFEF